MPDYPPIEGLKTAIEAKQKQYGQRPATPYPAMDRAVESLRREYPNDMADVNVRQMGLQNPFAFTYTVGTTDGSQKNVRPQHVELNPILEMLYPESLIQSTVAHELQHVRGNRGGTETPTESEARAQHFEREYSQAHGLPDTWQAFPDAIRPVAGLKSINHFLRDIR